ncbi:MAG: tRNA (adenosine(37)-N6)-threonylcarbamoyltransferase complex transferase subunit TsaD [Christensenellaceae bacterium]|jgi:N6-L-threonylcarbamoyladenine synthase|nr:tRNA (adenosine(37)-N6)-threonylcarbamoyltransferase complex transferase subunit TsaD [Christensenellaceae bacterium]
MEYYQTACTIIDQLRARDDYLILAIETSCDETAAAVTRGRTVLSDVVESQIDIHKKYGGVVPEIASRNHSLKIEATIQEALLQANVTLNDISVIAVTRGPGLLGALLVGLCHAKALAYARGIPFVCINHIKGHIAANYIIDPTLQPPFITLLASGGHTEILKVDSFNKIECLGSTCDDAAGEAFDKVARVLNLPYPGGPEIEKLALTGRVNQKLPYPFRREKHLNFSFSGIKTAVINLVANAKRKGQELASADVAASFQALVANILTRNTIEAAKRTGINTVALAGGVGANSELRRALEHSCAENQFKLILPPKRFCTDNASMIGVACFEEIKIGIVPSGLEVDADPSLSCII